MELILNHTRPLFHANGGSPGRSSATRVATPAVPATEIPGFVIVTQCACVLSGVLLERSWGTV